jgi:hypothetical protein
MCVSIFKTGCSKKSLIIPKVESEDTKGGIRRYQRGNQKIPKGDSEDTKGETEDTKGGIKRYQRGNQKIPKG